MTKKKASVRKSDGSVTAQKVENLEDKIEKICAVIASLEENYQADLEVQTQLANTVNGLETKFADAVKGGGSPAGVTNLDPDTTYQHCLQMGLTSALGNQNISLLANNPVHLRTAIDQSIKVADAMHEALCEKFQAE